jgi:hypothetical protein
MKRGSLDVVSKHLPQFGDRALQHVVGDKRVSPDRMDEPLFGHDFARMLGETDGHHFQLKRVVLSAPMIVLLWGSMRKVADSEVTIHSRALWAGI